MAQSEKRGNINNELPRILYYEPNDSAGYVDGNPLTPDYSDMCVSFALYVDVVSRYTPTGGGLSDKQYIITWNTYYDEQGNAAQPLTPVNFMHGDDSTGKPFLSTYYTDTTFDDIRRDSRVVEGLGVESVTVAFENYYAPTATIKFVDQRGSALFGREELNHDNDEITADTVFGCFFTQPYPRFRLQVKGFFGNAVTYQLVCSGFKGNLNPSTGNFEAVVSFIGYQYGILTDVPFNYLVAAPYSEYIGRSYWAAHVGDPSWQLADGSGRSVITLYDLFERVESVLSDDELVKSVTNAEADGLTSIGESGRIVEDAVNGVNSLIGRFKECTGAKGVYISPTDAAEYQVLFTYDGVSGTMDMDRLKESWEAVNASIQTLNDAAAKANENAEAEDGRDNGGTPASVPRITLGPGNVLSEFPSGVTPVAFFNPPPGGTGRYTYSAPSKMSADGLTGRTVQSGSPKITSDLSSVVYEDFQDGGKQRQAAQYAYLITFGDVRRQLAALSGNVHRVEEAFKEDISQRYLEIAETKLGFIPYIGNIFHILMAHLETLTHMMYELADTVAANRAGRTPVALGLVDYNAGTDSVVNMTKTVPVWPAIYKKSGDSDRYSTGEDDSDVLGWVGDVSHNFEEEKFVKALYSASYRTRNGGESDGRAPKEILYLPVNGFDVIHDGAPFRGMNLKEGQLLSAMGGAAGLRVSQLFGVCDTDTGRTNEAMAAGRMDGYNFFLNCGNRGALQTLLEQVGGAAQLDGVLYGIMTCGSSGDSYAVATEGGARHLFEISRGVPPKVKEGRHPVLAEAGDTSCEYVYITTRDRHGLVPADIKISEANDYAGWYRQGTDGGDPYYTATEDGLRHSLYVQPSSVVQAESGLGNVSGPLLRVYTDQSVVDGILKKHGEMKSGKFTVGSEVYEEDLSVVLDRYWDVEFKDVYAADGVVKTRCMLTPTYKSCGVDNGLWGSTDTVPAVSYDGVVAKLYADPVKDEKDGFKRNGGSVGLDQLFFPQLPFYTEKNGVDYEYNCLFTSDTYLRQTDDKSKAYLFVMAMVGGMPFDNGIISKRPVVEVLPYGWYLKTGAAMWRHRQMETGDDPILLDTSRYRRAGKDESYVVVRGENMAYCTGGVVDINGGKYGYCRTAYSEASDEEFEVGIRLFEDFCNGDEWRRIKSLTDQKLTCQSLEALASAMREAGSRVDEELEGFEPEEGKTKEEEKTVRLNDCYGQLCRQHVAGFGTTFRAVKPTNDGLALLLDDSGELQTLLKSLMTRRAALCRSVDLKRDGPAVGSYSDIKVPRAIIDSYLAGFTASLEKIVKGETAQADASAEAVATQDKTGIRYERDIMISMYKYLKNLWDKWLIQEKRSTYQVSSFFLPNFKFVDSVYRNIHSRLMVNCQVLLDRYNGVRDREDVTLFKFIGDIVTDHHCMFLALPDFITFGNSLKDVRNERDIARNRMESIFTPVPYERMESPRQQNFFVVIYTPGLSSTPSGEFNGFQDETLNIWSMNGVNPNAPACFKRSNLLSEDVDGMTDIELITNRYGYDVPAFGVSFGRQDNHLFKNVRLSMDTPVVTSAVINTLSHISMKGSGRNHAIAFVGQDIYPVFSNYSYTAEVEMMGDAQIHPLMYFQLLNTPIWRGTYLIFNVTHQLTQGQMTTKFKGMKLAKYCMDYSSVWFTKKINFKEHGDDWDPCDDEYEDTPTNVETTSDNFSPPDGYMPTNLSLEERQMRLFGKHLTHQKPVETQAWCEKFMTTIQVDLPGYSGNFTCHKGLVENYKAIFSELSNMPGFEIKQNELYSYSWRGTNTPKQKNGPYLSNHSYGVAMDISWCINGFDPSMKRYPETGDTSDINKFRSFDHPVVKLCKKHGFGWGGAYGDLMHFSFFDGR